jgi:hypothetical protein
MAATGMITRRGSIVIHRSAPGGDSSEGAACEEIIFRGLTGFYVYYYT